MSKGTATRWYIGAWVVWLLAFVGLALAMHGSSWTFNSVPPGGIVGYGVLAVAAVVMFVMWVAALIRLLMLRHWAWFVGVLILHVIGLGIIGMVAYAVSGPDENHEVVYRPAAS